MESQYELADELSSIDGVDYKYEKGDVVRFKFKDEEFTLEILGFVKFISENPTYRFEDEDSTMYIINEKDIIEQVE